MPDLFFTILLRKHLTYEIDELEIQALLRWLITPRSKQNCLIMKIKETYNRYECLKANDIQPFGKKITKLSVTFNKSLRWI